MRELGRSLAASIAEKMKTDSSVLAEHIAVVFELRTVLEVHEDGGGADGVVAEGVAIRLASAGVEATTDAAAFLKSARSYFVSANSLIVSPTRSWKGLAGLR